MSAIGRVAEIIRILNQETKSDIRIQQINMLIDMMAAHPEPVSYAELAAKANISVAAVSRNIKVLGDKLIQSGESKADWMNIGLGLCKAYPDPYNTRQYVVELTKQGLTLKKKLEKALT